MLQAPTATAMRVERGLPAPGDAVYGTARGASPGSDDFSHPALRIYTGQRGLYRLTYQDLANAGVQLVGVDPASFALSYLGEPVAVEVTGADDGRFDPGDVVIFYAEPYAGRYMTRNVYWLTVGGPPGPRIAVREITPSGAEPVVTEITRTLHVEYDRVYYSTYRLPPAADHWFDNPLYANAAVPVITATYDLPLLDPVISGEVLLRAAFHGGAELAVEPDQSVEVSLNAHRIGRYEWDGSVPYLVDVSLPAAWLDSQPNRVYLTAGLDQLPGVTGYWVSPDWVEVTYTGKARAAGDRLWIEAAPPGAHEMVVAGFSRPEVRVYDVRDPRHPVALRPVQVKPSDGGYEVHFWDADLPDPAYALSAEAALLPPVALEVDTPSAWRTPDHPSDYIAIVHRTLWDAVQPLLDHRAAEGLRVAKVDVQDVYDEFSFGRVDPEAIRSFLAYAYRNWNRGEGPPKYVLLVGDGHYDFKGVQRPDLPNLIPPYLVHVDPWIGETAADNRYVSVDGPEDYLPDLHIGRIPAKTPADVSAVVEKIIRYETAAADGDWQRRTFFVADDKDNPAGNFHALSDQARLNWLPEGYMSQPIYYRQDAAHDTGEEMRREIKAAFNAGAIYLQWFGHASRQRWGSVSMFDVLDPPNLAPNEWLPFTANFTCWSGYFINITGSRQYRDSEQSLAEALLLTPGRGSIADLSPSGLHVGSALLALNQGLLKAVFVDRVERVGEAVDAARRYFYDTSSAWHDVIDTSILFGDPATRLRLPPGGPSPSPTPSPTVTPTGTPAPTATPTPTGASRPSLWLPMIVNRG